MDNRVSKRPVTLKDIAAATGFSINTVSHALKDREDISCATREAIKKTAKEMGYIGNASARFLRSGVSKLIAIILGDLSNPHFSIMVKEIETCLRREGYVSFVMNTDEKPEVERQAIMAAVERNADGILLCPTQNNRENLAYLQNTGIPFVLIGRRFPQEGCSYVVCDDENGGYAAARHLLLLGHRRILFLNGPASISSARERLDGYFRAHQELQVPVDRALILPTPVTLGKINCRRVGSVVRTHGATAVLAFSDLIAWEAISALREEGLHVPEDVSVVGFDNIQSKYPFPVQLTSVTSSKTTMARRASSLLLRMLKNRALPPEQLVLGTQLVVRDTTASPPQKGNRT